MTIPVSACPEQDCAQEHEQEDNTPRRFLVPYHASTGLLLSPDHTPAFTVLNLSDGAKVRDRQCFCDTTRSPRAVRVLSVVYVFCVRPLACHIV